MGGTKDVTLQHRAVELFYGDEEVTVIDDGKSWVFVDSGPSLTRRWLPRSMGQLKNCPFTPG